MPSLPKEGLPMKRSHLLPVALVLIFVSLLGIAMLDAWDRERDLEERSVPAEMAAT